MGRGAPSSHVAIAFKSTDSDRPVRAAIPDVLIDRRGVFTFAGAAAARCYCRARSRAAVAEAGSFNMGFAAGDPAPDGFVIWTRLAPMPLASDGRGGMTGPISVRWQVAEDEAMQRVARSGEAVADSRFAHSVHVERPIIGRPFAVVRKVETRTPQS